MIGFPFRLPVPPRRKSYSIEAFGLFHNAEVIRGPHWKWQDQDGISSLVLAWRDWVVLSNDIFSREFTYEIKMIFSQAVIFTLKYLKCYFHND